MAFDLRTAGPQDASELAALAEETFRDAFAAENEPEDVEAYCASAFGESQQARELADPLVRTFLAAHAGRLVGYGQLRRGAAPEGVPFSPAVEIVRLYVRSEWHGRGVAQALMVRLLQAARDDGASGVWLGVWERNSRAIRFYEKLGFRVVGDHVFLLGSDPQRDLVMAQPLADT